MAGAVTGGDRTNSRMRRIGLPAKPPRSPANMGILRLQRIPGGREQMPQEMRTTYHEQLADLSSQLGEMCGMAGSAMDDATRALLDADLAASEQVISDHDQMVAMSANVETHAINLLALQ